MRPALRGSRVKASRGFEPRSLDSESRVLSVTPRGQVIYFVCLLKTRCRVEERGSEAHCQEAEPQPGREQRLRAELTRDLWGVHIRAWHNHTKEPGWKEGSAGPGAKASRGFEPRSLDSESRVLTVTPRGHARGVLSFRFACTCRMPRSHSSVG